MTQTIDQQSTEADRALKAKHRAMWALGDYAAVADEIIGPLGPVLVEAAGIGPGVTVVDVAAGSGNVAIPAALAGAEVVATDLTPELLESGRQAAEAAGVTLGWKVADAEDMPCSDGKWDVVVSCVGVMFAPHHQVAADQLVRICRPGGTIALISWTPGGFIGEMFATLKPYAPPPPPGTQPPPQWGDEAHVRELFGDRVTVDRAEKHTLTVSHYATGAEFRDYFKRTYGPTIAVYRSIADDPRRTTSLDAELAALGERYLDAGGGVMEWEYLLLVGRRTA